jgi:hypothetical protein
MLTELLVVDGVIEAMLRPGWLSALDLIRLRAASSPLRALANSALAGLPPLTMLGAVDELLLSRDAMMAQYEAAASDADDERAELNLRGFVMCWSSGRWEAAPELNCTSEDPAREWTPCIDCRVLGPLPCGTASRPVRWPPERECLVLDGECNWAADYSLALAGAAAGAATPVVGAPLRREGTRRTRADAAILCGRWPTGDREGERLIFTLGSKRMVRNAWFESDEDDILPEEEQDDSEEEGHGAAVEYYPLDAEDESTRH